MRVNAKLVVTGAVLVLSLVPYPSLVAPHWDVTVRDENGAALGSVLVRETYQDYSAQSVGGEEDRYTDSHGHVEFESQRIWVSGLKRLFMTCSSATAFAHASFGPHDHVFAMSGSFMSDSIKNGVLEDWRGSPNELRSEIVLRGTNAQ